MNEQLQEVVESAIASATGNTTAIVKMSAAGGGCINETSIVTTQAGQKFFVKLNPNAPAQMFPAEAIGLRALRQTNAIRIPEVIAVNNSEVPRVQEDDPEFNFLVLEYIETGSQRRDFSACLGRQLAELHRAGSGDNFGFAHDNFIGATPQPNTPNLNWIEFWVQQRIGYQLKLAYENGFSEALDENGRRFVERIPSLIDSPKEPPSLIHGDLWSGNYLADASGNPVLIDPAVYYAHREAEFGMTTLFGGLDHRFYDAYRECWPLSEGWEDRVEIYRLYHLLNHLNLFGRSYVSGCLQIINKYA